MISLDIEVGVVRGNVISFAWKSMLSIVRTWWHDGETHEMYIVTYRGQEIIFATTGNAKNSRKHAEWIVNALNDRYNCKAVV